jgi:hypothetical protein
MASALGRPQLSDSKTEDYDFKADLPTETKDADQEHIVVVRAFDKYENQASAKTILKGR